MEEREYPPAEFDVFISHASEDKDGFVRELAHALEERNLRAWYDEFTLRPGGSLRRSIDRGLLVSQVGIVVLSDSFFAKRWPAYELDGLVELHAGGEEQVAGSERSSRIIPIWHKVDVAAVRRFSPSLANLVAIKSEEGVEAVADQILKAVKPTGSTLLFAYAELTRITEPYGWAPPIVTDDWWLDAVEASAANDLEGTFQSAMGWGHWGFPLPETGVEPQERGYRLAHAAAQMIWQRTARMAVISQVTPPEKILEFIDSSPGLADVCIQHPSYLLSYAPQLAIPNVAGWLQETVDDTVAWAIENVRTSGLDPNKKEGWARLAREYGYLVLHDVRWIEAAPAHAACGWIQGDIHGPEVSVHETIDYAAWLVSRRSAWLGDARRSALLDGIAKWAVWPTWREDLKSRDTETLLALLDGHPSPKRLTRISEIISRRLEDACSKLDLEEPAKELTERLLAARLPQEYLKRQKSRKRRD